MDIKKSVLDKLSELFFQGGIVFLGTKGDYVY